MADLPALKVTARVLYLCPRRVAVFVARWWPALAVELYARLCFVRVTVAGRSTWYRYSTIPAEQKWIDPTKREGD
jgi:hypothetical protein